MSGVELFDSAVQADSVVYICLSVYLWLCVCVAVCPGGCGAGQCQAPFQCACPAGHTGDRCETGEQHHCHHY